MYVVGTVWCRPHRTTPHLAPPVTRSHLDRDTQTRRRVQRTKWIALPTGACRAARWLVLCSQAAPRCSQRATPPPPPPQVHQHMHRFADHGSRSVHCLGQHHSPRDYPRPRLLRVALRLLPRRRRQPADATQQLRRASHVLPVRLDIPRAQQLNHNKLCRARVRGRWPPAQSWFSAVAPDRRRAHLGGAVSGTRRGSW